MGFVARLREAYSHLDEVYFDLGSSVVGLLGWTDPEMVVAS